MDTPEVLLVRRKALHLVSTKDAARHLGLSTAYLEKLRVEGGGCVYRKIGSRVLYDMVDLEAWAGSYTRRNTAEYRRSRQSNAR